MCGKAFAFALLLLCFGQINAISLEKFSSKLSKVARGTPAEGPEATKKEMTPIAADPTTEPAAGQSDGEVPKDKKDDKPVTAPAEPTTEPAAGQSDGEVPKDKKDDKPVTAPAEPTTEPALQNEKNDKPVTAPAEPTSDAAAGRPSKNSESKHSSLGKEDGKPTTAAEPPVAASENEGEGTNVKVEKDADAMCEDKADSCAAWAVDNYCEQSSVYHDFMMLTCPLSCKQCTGICEDENQNCVFWKTEGYCDRESSHEFKQVNFVVHHCKKTCGICSQSMGADGSSPAPMETREPATRGTPAEGPGATKKGMTPIAADPKSEAAAGQSDGEAPKDIKDDNRGIPPAEAAVDAGQTSK